MSRPLHLLIVTLILTAVFASPSAVAASPRAEQYLVEGRIKAGIADLEQHLQGQPRDSQARFELGVVQFMGAVGNLAESLHRFGLKPGSNWIPFLRLPLPTSDNPQPITYDELRGIYARLLQDLTTAEKTLAQVQGDVKLPLHFGRIRLDLNGDGKADADEMFWKIYAQLNRQVDVSPQVAEQYLITFDTADVYWLRGYCHLLMALNEFILAHDWKNAFEHSAQLFFLNPKTAYPYLGRDGDQFSRDITDAIALIHLIHFPVQEPERMKAALEHLQAMIGLSRECWTSIEAETDDDHEWLPGPKQTGVIPGVRITGEMVSGWRDFLKEAEAILRGELLVPHWRVSDGRGINLRRVFVEPREFDLVLWIHGSGAAPYLEKGTVTHPETWTRFQRIFQGQFIGFAIWIN